MENIKMEDEKSPGSLTATTEKKEEEKTPVIDPEEGIGNQFMLNNPDDKEGRGNGTESVKGSMINMKEGAISNKPNAYMISQEKVTEETVPYSTIINEWLVGAAKWTSFEYFHEREKAWDDFLKEIWNNCTCTTSASCIKACIIVPYFFASSFLAVIALPFIIILSIRYFLSMLVAGSTNNAIKYPLYLCVPFFLGMAIKLCFGFFAKHDFCYAFCWRCKLKRAVSRPRDRIDGINEIVGV